MGDEVEVHMQDDGSGHREVVAALRAELTGREQEILRHIAQGATSMGNARQLRIAESTVKVHVKNLLK